MVTRLFSSLLARLELIPLTLAQASILFATSVLIRTFLESFTNANNNGSIDGFIDTLFHYPLFFLCVFLSTILIVSFVGKVSVVTVRNYVAFGSFLIVLPPLIDFFFYGSTLHPYDFVIDSIEGLTFHFGTLMMFAEGITVGIKTEILIALLGSGVYLYTKTKNIIRTGLGMLLMYISIFFFLTIPVWGMGIYNAITPTKEPLISTQSVQTFYSFTEPSASLTWPRSYLSETSTFAQNTLHNFSLSISIILLCCVLLLTCVLYYRYSSQKFFAIIKNIRVTRILLYVLLLGFGMYLAQPYGIQYFPSLTDILAVISLCISFVCAWLFAVWQNDYHDTSIDSISNTDRPLVHKKFTTSEWKEIQWILFIIMIVSSLLSQWYTFIFILLFTLLYHAYSCPPLRLKKFPVISSVIVAVNATLVMLMGFYQVSTTDSLLDFPRTVLIGMFIILLLIENIKNIKDIEGDRVHHIYTLPALLGEKNGKIVVGILSFIATLLVPTIFSLSYVSFIFSLLFGIFFFILITRKHYREMYVFSAYFLYTILFFFLFL